MTVGKESLVFERIGNKFLDGLDIGYEDKRNILVNQLSEAKIYAHPNVNKSITARFKIIGIYDFVRNLSSIWLRIFSLHISKKHHMFIAVLSANVKSSTSTMVYIAGIFHLASIE